MVPRLDKLVSVINKIEADAGTGVSSTYDRAAMFLGAAKLSRYNSFLPRWSNPELFVDTTASVQSMEKLATRQDKARRVACNGDILITRWQPPQIELLINAETPLKVEVLQLYYPGWVARIDGGTARLDITPSSPDGLLEIRIPSGTHRIFMERESLPQERAGQSISILSIFILSGFGFWLRLRRYPIESY